MQIDTEAWTTGSEAARILGVSSTRVMAMAEEGSLEVIRPWPRMALISRRSMAEWVAGARPPKISALHVRRWLFKDQQVTSLADIDVNVMRDQVRAFIEDARPRWENERKDLWALQMASQLHRAATNAA